MAKPDTTPVRRMPSLTPKSADIRFKRVDSPSGAQDAGLQTLINFILEEQRLYGQGGTGNLTRLLYDIALASKLCHREINKAGLADILGEVGNENVQGEQQKKLDIYANEQFIAALSAGDTCAAIVSEEDEDLVVLERPSSKKGKYIIAIDPLDGSSNIDVNVSVGTIFSVYRRDDPCAQVNVEEFLRPGREQVAAGYIIYGSSTMMVYTTGHGVNGFTYDPSIGEYCLSHPNIKTPPMGQIYSINSANLGSMPQGFQSYVNACQMPNEKGKRTHTARYIGSLVADFHRNLLKGGIFLYPESNDAPKGKLRLLYECNPVAFLIEQAGGKATDGKIPILDVQPATIHDRTPIIVGSTEMVDAVHMHLEKHNGAA